jgi:hypothetical protein
MLVTLFGILREERDEQPAKTLSPMRVMLLGMVIEVSEEHAEKAPAAMNLTL